MSNIVGQIRDLLAKCTPGERREIFDYLRQTIQLHPFETTINARAEVIMEALNRSGALTLRGIRGIIGEASFTADIVSSLKGWEDVTPPGDLPYDSVLRDGVGTVRVQVKMQRRTKGVPWIKNGCGIVEVQRTRTGKGKDGAATRPYRFGEFDILAVCMEPSHQRWNSFHYIPERWLKPRAENATLIDIMQPVSLKPDEVWTDDFNEVVLRLRSGLARPEGRHGGEPALPL